MSREITIPKKVGLEFNNLANEDVRELQPQPQPPKEEHYIPQQQPQKIQEEEDESEKMAALARAYIMKTKDLLLNAQMLIIEAQKYSNAIEEIIKGGK